MLKSVVGSLSTRRRGVPRGRDTSEEILNAAEDLLQRRGYNAFSYHHIAVQLGVRNAAIHYHYPSKESLGVALVKRYQERFRAWIDKTDGTACAWARLQAYFQTYIDFLQADHLVGDAVGLVAGAVRSGGDGAGARLAVDVAHRRHGEPARAQRLAQLEDARSRPHRRLQSRCQSGVLS